MGIASTLLVCTLLVQQPNTISLPPEVGQFNVVGGRPCVVVGGGGPPGNALDRHGESLVHYRSKKPLAYSLDGDSKEVVLGSGGEKGMSPTWEIVATEGSSGGGEAKTIRAARGKLKGWYLDCADEEEAVMSEGRRITIRRLVLVENPRHIRRFYEYPVSK